MVTSRATLSPLAKIKNSPGIHQIDPRVPHVRIPGPEKARTRAAIFEAARKIAADSCTAIKIEGRGKKEIAPDSRVGSNWIWYEVGRESAGVEASMAERCGTIRSPTAHRQAITSHRRVPSQTITNRALVAPYPSAVTVSCPLRTHSRLYSSVSLYISVSLLPAAFQPHRDPTSSRTYHCRSISISDRLAPTSQECDTARNSFELHISLGPAK